MRDDTPSAAPLRRKADMSRRLRRLRDALHGAVAGDPGRAVLTTALREVASAIGATALRIEPSPGPAPATRRPPVPSRLVRGRSGACEPPRAGGRAALGVLYAQFAGVRRRRHDASLLPLTAHELAATVGRVTVPTPESGRAPRVEDVIGMLAHELRTPLATIASTLHVLARPGRDPGRAEAGRHVIERQVGYLTRLLDRLLDLGSVAHGTVELQRAPIDLNDVLAAALDVTLPSIERQNQRLAVSLPEEGLPIRGDATRLQQVFVNLLANATKYTGAGGHIAVRAVRVGDEAVVGVKDSGDGIPSAMLQRVFEPFVRAPGRPHGALTGGLGIGLALVKRLVEAHGGTVEAHSAGRHRGSEFVVRLKLNSPRGGHKHVGTSPTLRTMPRDHRARPSSPVAG